MLHFANKPDKIFRILLEEALDDMLRVLSARDHSLAEGGLLYPKEMRKQVHALKAALADTTLYQLTEYHWFLLYEAVLGWCESVNEMPELSRVYTDYGIGYVDFDPVFDLFFADTDFLGYPTGGFTAEQLKRLQDPDEQERCRMSDGLKPPLPDKLAMTVCSEEWRRQIEAAESVPFPSTDVATRFRVSLERRARPLYCGSSSGPYHSPGYGSMAQSMSRP